MPPTDYRRRRRRRSRLARLGVVALVAAILVGACLLLLVGGISRASRESGPYWDALDRSYAVQVRPLVRRSNEAHSQFQSVVAGMASDTRASLEASLDTLVSTTETLARAAATISTPPPAAGAGADITGAMADRAVAVADLRRTVDGLLGMSPLPDPGGTITATASRAGVLSAPAGESMLGKVGALLAAADRLYAEGRRALERAPGDAGLPTSAWLRRTPAWPSGGAQSVVRALLESSSLTAVDDVVLVPHALVLTPAPVPPAQGSGVSGTLRLPPTRRLSLTAVVAEEGNVAARGVVVEARLERPSHGGVLERSAPETVTARGAASLSLAALRVVPGDHYMLTVRVVSSSSSPGAHTSQTLSVSIAPPAPAAVTQLSPAQGSPRGGTAVTILGVGLTSVTAVDFGKVRARFTEVSKSQITAVAPPGHGVVTVTLVDAGGNSVGSTASRFTYKVPARKGSS